MNIFIGNLAHAATEDQLKELFAPYGEIISAKIIMDRETGRSRGFAFVDLASAEEGQRAIDELNGHEFVGRPLRVSEANQREQRPRSGGNGGNGGGGFDRRPRGRF